MTTVCVCGHPQGDHKSNRSPITPRAGICLIDGCGCRDYRTGVELDYCPVCGYLARARGAEPGLCPDTTRHPGHAVEPAPSAARETVWTAGHGRTRLVRIRADLHEQAIEQEQP